MKRKAKLRDERDTLTPSTTRISPQTYRLAALARKTTGQAKSRGSPHRPAGMRSEIWRRRTGSCSSFSFLYVKAESKGSEGRVSIVRLGVATSAIEGVAAEWSDAVRQRPRYDASSDVEKSLQPGSQHVACRTHAGAETHCAARPSRGGMRRRRRPFGRRALRRGVRITRVSGHPLQHGMMRQDEAGRVSMHPRSELSRYRAMV